MNITILGGGNGAFATAADLSSQGHDVTIYVTEAYKKHVEGIKESLEIRCIGDGPNGTFPIKNVTHDLRRLRLQRNRHYRTPAQNGLRNARRNAV